VQVQATKYNHGIRELFAGDNRMIDRLGATRLGVWMIKHIVAPAQRLLYRASGGRMFTSTGAGREVLLLTTRGRLTGKDRTTPLYYLRDGNRIIICNVNPGFERTNPWVANLRAHPIAKLQIGPEIAEYHAREATEAESDFYWPRLINIWPAYNSHFEKSHQRAIFVLERR
jgi:deazaflavin-dependent oxidoreductase (nitroreductase family)